jgi:hypothetical protein
MSHPNYGVSVQPLTFDSTVAGPSRLVRRKRRKGLRSHALHCTIAR